MYFQTILAGAIGASLTFAVQHLLSILQHRRDERGELLKERRQVLNNLVQVIHRMGQQTGDYIEISQRGSLDADYWEKFRVILNEAWRDFSDAMVRLPGLGDSELLRSARRIHTLFALRINCFYNEHPDAINSYIRLLDADYPELIPERFHWSLDTAARNRKLYWSLTREIDDRTLKMAQLESKILLRQLREMSPADTPRIDDSEIYERDDCWPVASLIVLRHFRL